MGQPNPWTTLVSSRELGIQPWPSASRLVRLGHTHRAGAHCLIPYTTACSRTVVVQPPAFLCLTALLQLLSFNHRQKVLDIRKLKMYFITVCRRH